MDAKSNDDSGGSDSLDKSMQRKCVMVDTETSSAAASEPAAERTDNCSGDSGEEQELPPGEPKTNSSESSTVQVQNESNNITTTTTTAAFETKVTLISQNLKETTLAETDREMSDIVTINDSNSSSSSSSNDDSRTTDMLNPTQDSDQRIKKVRFHPDVKENDGGNRVKKKRRASIDGENPACDGMDIDDDDDDNEQDGDGDGAEDEDEEDEKEEEFNLAKTMSEAEDYLKQHPLTFVKRIELNGEHMRDGMLHVDDMPQFVEPVESIRMKDNYDSAFYNKCMPENGIERVLGKEIRAGKVEFLLRYEDDGGLFWESEEFIRRTCPTLLRAYEKCRERRQQRLMHHVAKRQTQRQRYTDF